MVILCAGFDIVGEAMCLGSHICCCGQHQTDEDDTNIWYYIYHPTYMVLEIYICNQNVNHGYTQCKKRANVISLSQAIVVVNM